MTQDWLLRFEAAFPLRDPEMPDRCQQFGCHAPAVTWCPLCRAYFCAEHDSLYPRRRHDCLRGKAEAA